MQKGKGCFYDDGKGRYRPLKRKKLSINGFTIEMHAETFKDIQTHPELTHSLTPCRPRYGRYGAHVIARNGQKYPEYNGWDTLSRQFPECQWRKIYPSPPASKTCSRWCCGFWYGFTTITPCQENSCCMSSLRRRRQRCSAATAMIRASHICRL